MILLLLACTPEAPVDTAWVDPPVFPADDAHLVPLDAPRLARRLSLDLRGVLPTTAELDAVEADPAALATLRESWLADPRFEDRLVVLLGERWHTRVDDFLMYVREYPELAGDARNEYPFERAVGEEPLRLMARVAAEDRPWTEIVTADWTMSHRVVSGIWPVDRAFEGEEWEVSHYTDGRPPVGVLATNGLWWRYFSTLSNLNRGRAAAIARLLLCEDYLSRPVSFVGDDAVLDADGVEGALRSNPYCMGCHSSLDPIASALFGFYAANEYNADEAERYHAAREPFGEAALGLAPEWYGTPVPGLQAMTQAMADDPRFARCAARTAAELYWRRPLVVEDHDRVEAVLDAYRAGDGRFSAAIRAATDAAVYRAGGVTGEATEAEHDGEATLRLLDATLLEPMIYELTGFQWVELGFFMLDNDTYGYRVMGGSVDGEQVTRVQTTPGLNWALTVRRVAEGAAQDVVGQMGEPGTLLEGVTVDSLPGDDAFTTTLDTLHWRLYATRPDPAWREDTEALWLAAAEQSDPSLAWKSVLAAMFRDPLFVGY